MNSPSASASERSARGGPPREAAFDPAPARAPAHPALKWLAIGGWGVFAVEWLVTLLVLTSLVSRDGRVGVEAAPSAVIPPPIRTPTNPAPVRTPDRTPPPPTTATNPTAVSPAAANAPRVLGLDPGAGHTVIVLDAVARSAPWLDRAKTKLIEGLSKPGPADATFSLVTINDDGGRGLINRSLNYGPAAAEDLRKALGPLQAKGTRGLGAGLDAAGKLGADQVVFITSRDSKWGDFVAFLEQKLSVDGKRIRLDVVQVNDEPVDELRAFVTGSNGGTYVQVAPGSI